MAWRAGIATHSKFRNVYGEPYRKDKSYENIRISKNAWDGTYCAANPKFLAVVLDTSGAGGAFLVIPIEKVGHQKTDLPRVAGHQREVLDIQWNPFNDHIIASASEDTTVKIWRIPSGGLTEDLHDPLVDLRGHQRKVGLIRWHPTANGIIASAAFDFKVIVWNALKAKALCTIDGHRDTIYDIAFNYNGSLLATTSKDKKIRVINARTGKILQAWTGHTSPKVSHISFTDQVGDHLVSTGFGNTGEREVSLWSLDKPSAVKTDTVDHSSSILMLHYDMDIKVAYIAGKGDGMIRYYEVLREEPYLFRLSEYRHPSPQKSLGKISKRALDTSKCEIYRFYKIHPNNWIEPLSMICPRRSDEFQQDLYPPFPSVHPALTADEWMGGTDKDPNLMSFTEEGIRHDTQSGTSSADKYNSLFNKPAKFEKQNSKDEPIPNDIGRTAEGGITRSTFHEVHAVNDEELQKYKKLCKDQEKEIEDLKRTISTKDQRIFKLEMELSSKNAETSDIKQELSRTTVELREANHRLAARQAGTSSVDGGPPRAGEVTVGRATNQVTVPSMPGSRPMLVEESITPSRKSREPLDDFDLDRALADTMVQPVCGIDASQEKVQTTDAHRESTRTTATYGIEPEAKNPVQDYRIEDIEAELESLREDLVKTREVRHGGKTSVRYMSDDQGQNMATNDGGYSRTVYSESTPRQGSYSNYSSSPPKSSSYGSRSPPKSGYGYSEAGKAPFSAGGAGESAGRSGKSDGEGSRMVITTTSYARTRLPSHEKTSNMKDKKSYL